MGLEGCSLPSTICNMFPCQEFSHETPTGLSKHVCFGPVADNPIYVKSPSLFPELDLKSTYMPRFDPSE